MDPSLSLIPHNYFIHKSYQLYPQIYANCDDFFTSPLPPSLSYWSLYFHGIPLQTHFMSPSPQPLCYNHSQYLSVLCTSRALAHSVSSAVMLLPGSFQSRLLLILKLNVSLQRLFSSLPYVVSRSLHFYSFF